MHNTAPFRQCGHSMTVIIKCSGVYDLKAGGGQAPPGLLHIHIPVYVSTYWKKAQVHQIMSNRASRTENDHLLEKR